MIDRDQKLTQRIMRRVYAVWFWKSVAPVLAVELVLLGGVVGGVLAVISPKHILMNALTASDGAFAFLQFFVDNFFVKSIQSQMLALLWVVVAAFFARDVRNTVRRFRDIVRGGAPAVFAGERRS